MGEVECFIDPVCPWSAVTASWLRTVRDAGAAQVGWRLLSLAELDQSSGHSQPAHVAAAHARGREHLAVLAAVGRREGHEALDRALAAIMAAVWPASDGSRDVDRDDRRWMAARELDTRGLLAAVGVDPAAVDDVRDEDHARVVAETATAMARVGGGLGSPVVTLDAPDGPSFFGPVLAAPPVDRDEAVRAWDALTILASQPGFAELRTNRREAPAVLRAIAGDGRLDAPRDDRGVASILAVIRDPDRRAAMADVLRRRYRPDFDVQVVAEPDAAVDLLATLDDVAVLLAPIAGPEFAVMHVVRRHHPHARRVAIVDVGDRAIADELNAALTLNVVDAFVGQPWASPDEELHPVVGEALRTRVVDRGEAFDKAVVVDASATGRGREIVTGLVSNGVASRLHLATSEEGGRLLRGPLRDVALPAVLLWDGRVLGDPGQAELAEQLGGNTRPRQQRYDVAVVGAGPAGLAAAVYAASEGLRTALVEANAIGGQARTSTSIRNYLGFSPGVRGSDLARAAIRQADQFGVEEVVTHRAVALEVDGHDRLVHLSSGDTVRAGSVVLACGVAYRRLGVPSVDGLVGHGVFYGAGTAEAAAMGGRHVFVLGGGNSAGQAAAHLADHGAEVEVLLRGDDLGKRMSDYLVQQLTGMERVSVRHHVEVTGGLGERQLAGLVLTDRRSGETEEVAGDALFVFIGARPHTDWLRGVVELDDRGFVRTGRDGARWLETSVPGVFAVGDVREGSVKRVAAAVGEGSTASMLVRERLDRAA